VTIPEIIEHFDREAGAAREAIADLRRFPIPETALLAAERDGWASACESAARIMRAFQEGRP
jgi:hypothetical protein